jgi:hypothetical protein
MLNDDIVDEVDDGMNLQEALQEEQEQVGQDEDDADSMDSGNISESASTIDGEIF